MNDGQVSAACRMAFTEWYSQLRLTVDEYAMMGSTPISNAIIERLKENYGFTNDEIAQYDHVIEDVATSYYNRMLEELLCLE